MSAVLSQHRLVALIKEKVEKHIQSHGDLEPEKGGEREREQKKKSEREIQILNVGARENLMEERFRCRARRK